MKHVEELRKANRLLMAEIQNLNLNTDEGRKRRLEIKGQLQRNNQDIKAYAVALGKRDQMPRIFKYRRNAA